MFEFIYKDICIGTTQIVLTQKMYLMAFFFFFLLLVCSTSTSKLNVLVTKLHEFLAHAGGEDGGQTPTSKDAEGTVDATEDRNDA